MRPLYAVLQLSPNASPEEVKQVRFVERSRCQNSWRFPQLRWKSCVESPNKSIVVSGIGDIYHPIGSIYHWYTTYSPWKLGGYIYIYHLPPIKGTRNSYWQIGKPLVVSQNYSGGGFTSEHVFWDVFECSSPEGNGWKSNQGWRTLNPEIWDRFPPNCHTFSRKYLVPKPFFCFHGEFLFQFHR